MKDNLPNGETILRQLNWRYAVKGFDPSRKVSEEDLEAILNATILAPSSYGLQPYNFVVVGDEEMKEKLSPCCFNQPQITDCSHLVVFAAKKELTMDDIEEYANLIVEVRGTSREKLDGLVNMMKGTQKKLETTGTAKDWAQRQTYIALGFMVETAAILGVDACPMEGFEPEKVDKVLGLERYTSSALCALGYRSGEDWLESLEKVRFPASRLIQRI